MPVLAEVQEAWLVMSCMVGCDPLPNVPVAVNCNVEPAAIELLTGVT
jgi:hypothetical protein